MPLPNFTIEQLRKLKISQLMAMAEKMTDEYVELIKEVPVSDEATQCRELIVRIHNIIDEKVDSGQV
jgi:hypothetical protein